MACNRHVVFQLIVCMLKRPVIVKPLVSRACNNLEEVQSGLEGFYCLKVGFEGVQSGLEGSQSWSE